MRVEINSRSVLQDFDPATVAKKRCMSADVRFEMIAPDVLGFITIKVISEDQQDAILQGIEIE